MKTYLIAIFFLIQSAPAFCQQFRYPTIDYLANDIKVHPTGSHFHTLTQSLWISGALAESHVKKIRAHNSKKSIQKVGVVYIKAQENVNNYLDSLTSYINMCPERLEYYQACNDQLKIALHSIEKLNKLFKKEAKKGIDSLNIIINDKSSIKIVIEETATWQYRFVSCVPGVENGGNDLKLIRKAYWTKWAAIK